MFGERHAQHRAVDAGAQGLQAADDVGHPNEGAGGIVDGHEVGRMCRQGFQAVQDRLLPAGATGDRRWQVHPLDGSLIEGLVP